MTEGIKLSNIIDYKRDIAPYRFIELIAGPGAGKNTLIELLAKGELPGAPKMRVLLITSRRAKVDETFDLYENADNESLSLFKRKIGEAWELVDNQGRDILATLGNTICTTAFVAGYLKYVYKPDDRRTHLWDMYDLIVVDEVHSLALDATYQNAPFHIYDLIAYYLDLCVSDKYPAMRCKHLITMTATGDAVSDYSAEMVWASYMGDERMPTICLDRRTQCENIQPRNVRFTERLNAKRLLERAISGGKRCIYFFNQIDGILKIWNESPILRDRAVMSFADETRRKALQDMDTAAWDNMVLAEESIKTQYKIPEQFSALLTTSKYREGINIEDNIDIMIVESHNATEVIQMAGRVRSGVEDLYIVVDALKHATDYGREDIERKIADILVNPANRRDRKSPINALLKKVPEGELQKIIDTVEAKTPYLRYSYLDKCFLWNSPRLIGISYIKKQDKLWATAFQRKRLQEYVREWFPEAIVHPYVSDYESKCSDSWRIMDELGIKEGVIFSGEIYDQLKKKLDKIWDCKQPNRSLKKFSKYKIIRAGKENKGYKMVPDVGR